LKKWKNGAKKSIAPGPPRRRVGFLQTSKDNLWECIAKKVVGAVPLTSWV